MTDGSRAEVNPYGEKQRDGRETSGGAVRHARQRSAQAAARMPVFKTRSTVTIDTNQRRLLTRSTAQDRAKAIGRNVAPRLSKVSMLDVFGRTTSGKNPPNGSLPDGGLFAFRAEA